MSCTDWSDWREWHHVLKKMTVTSLLCMHQRIKHNDLVYLFISSQTHTRTQNCPPPCSPTTLCTFQVTCKSSWNAEIQLLRYSKHFREENSNGQDRVQEIAGDERGESELWLEIKRPLWGNRGDPSAGHRKEQETSNVSVQLDVRKLNQSYASSPLQSVVVHVKKYSLPYVYFLSNGTVSDHNKRKW